MAKGTPQTTMKKEARAEKRGEMIAQMNADGLSICRETSIAFIDSREIMDSPSHPDVRPRQIQSQ
jgi:hypothetical protein